MVLLELDRRKSGERQLGGSIRCTIAGYTSVERLLCVILLHFLVFHLLKLYVISPRGVASWVGDDLGDAERLLDDVIGVTHP